VEPLRALLFGLTIGAPVGPIALLLVHIGLNHGLFAGSLVVQSAYAAFGAMPQRWLSDARAVRRFNVASGTAIAFFGLYGLARAVR